MRIRRMTSRAPLRSFASTWKANSERPSSFEKGAPCASLRRNRHLWSKRERVFIDSGRLTAYQRLRLDASSSDLPATIHPFQLLGNLGNMQNLRGSALP